MLEAFDVDYLMLQMSKLISSWNGFCYGQKFKISNLSCLFYTHGIWICKPLYHAVLCSSYASFQNCLEKEAKIILPTTIFTLQCNYKFLWLFVMGCCFDLLFLSYTFKNIYFIRCLHFFLSECKGIDVDVNKKFHFFISCK